MLGKEDYIEIRARFMERLDKTREYSDRELREALDGFVLEEGRRRLLSFLEKEKLRKYLLNSLRGLDVLQDLLEDEQITEIMVNGPENIFVERGGKLERFPAAFTSAEKLEDVIQQIVSKVNRSVNDTTPTVDARLPDGSRVHVVLAPVAINGPAVTIRKFPPVPVTMEQLIGWGSISEEAAGFLKRLVEAKYNIFISGGTGSGKTTMLNALSEYISEEERVITIEDSAELKLVHIPNQVRLEARNKNLEGKNEITIRDLIREALRMRPSRIIIGEVRAGEALDMLQAMNTGHDGSLSTGHGNNPQDMLKRLEVMVLMAADLPLMAIRSQIASAIDIMVHLSRFRDGTRKVVSIMEVTGIQNGEIAMHPLYEFREEKDGAGRGNEKEDSIGGGGVKQDSAEKDNRGEEDAGKGNARKSNAGKKGTGRSCAKQGKVVEGKLCATGEALVHREKLESAGLAGL